MTALLRKLFSYFTGTKAETEYNWAPAIHEADHDTVDALNGKNWG